MILDADMHVVEPPDLWSRLGIEGTGWADVVVRGQQYPLWRFPVDYERLAKGPLRDGYLDSWRVDSTLRAMDKMDIERAVLFPFRAGILMAVPFDMTTAFRICAIYNGWVANYIAGHRDRLLATGVFHAGLGFEFLEELLRGAINTGLTGMCRRLTCHQATQFLDDKGFVDLYDAMVKVNMPLLLHEGTVGLPYELGMSRSRQYLDAHAMSHVFEAQAAILRLLYGGVFIRHPKLRVGILECGVNWVWPWLDHLDANVQGPAGVLQYPYQKPPSNYAVDSLWVGCLPHEATWAAEKTTPFGNVLWGSDYPHGDGNPVRPIDTILDVGDIPVFNRNWRQLYLGDE